MGKFDGMLLISDLDGTLLTSEKVLHPKNTEALEYFVREGGLFTVASGRSLNDCAGLLAKLPVNAPVVLFNGAMLYEPREDKVLYALELGEEIREAAQMIGESGLPVDMQVFDRKTSYSCLLGYRGREGLGCGEEGQRPPADVPLPWIKILLRAKHEILEEVRERLEEGWPGLFSAQYSSAEYMEVTVAGASKALGAAKLAGVLAAHPLLVCAAGDGLNDADLLQSVDVAFVPANAPGVVKAFADVEVCSNDEGALAACVAWLEAQLREGVAEAAAEPEQKTGGKGFVPGQVLTAEEISPKSRVAVLVLCLFLGVFGVHRFYTGKVWSGLAYLCTFGFLGIGWLMDMINIFSGTFIDKQGRAVLKF